MIAFASLLAPFALLLPLLGDSQPRIEDAGLSAEAALAGGGSASRTDWFEVMNSLDLPNANQVRIERRIILRVSPRPGVARQSLAATAAASGGRMRLVERSFGECLDVSAIAAVQAQRGSRLLLYLRDRRLIAANLEKACEAQNYYSGFYLEQSDDGRLCTGRDHLQARNGMRCSVSSLRQIVAVQAAEE